MGDGGNTGDRLKLISYDPDPSSANRDRHYVLSYSSLREDYLRYTMMSNEEFSAELLNILHFACIVCWLKEKQAQWLLSDVGLIHEIVHLLLAQSNSEFTTDTKLSKVREMFNENCCLA